MPDPTTLQAMRDPTTGPGLVVAGRRQQGISLRGRVQGSAPRVRGVSGGEALLLVGHGSRCLASPAEMDALRRLVEPELPGVEVATGYLELTDPPAGVVADRLVAGGARRLVVLPLMLLGAGHAKSDVPAVVVSARERHRHAVVALGGPLGLAREVVAVLGDAISGCGGAGLPLLMVARGTSDPDANGDAVKAARLLAEWTGAPFVQTAFSGVTGPGLSEALDIMVRLGHRRFVVAWWFLCHGRLVERGRSELAATAAALGLSILDAGHIGPHPALAPLVAKRYHQALSGAVELPCDACAYRAPWPGRAERVGQAIGVGHSHLAEEHRHRGHALDHPAGGL